MNVSKRTFKYRAKAKDGQTVVGVVEAADERSAASAIREKGQTPLDITLERTVQGTKEAGSAFARYVIYPLYTGVNIRHLALFFRQLATTLHAGMSLSEALTLQSSKMRGKLGRIVRETKQRVQDGGLVSEVFAQYPKIFSPLVISLLKVGETSGLLDTVVDRIASYLEYEIVVRRRIVMALFYPITLVVVMVLLGPLPVLVLKGLKPYLQALGESLRIALPAFIVTLVFMKWLFQFRPVRLVWDTIKTFPPIIGTVAHKIAMSRFSKALALLYSAGVPMNEAVYASAEAAGNVAVGNRVKCAVPALTRGESLVASLTKTRAIAPMVLDMLAIGERTGDIDSALNKTSEYLESEIDNTLQKLAIIIFVLALLLVALVIGAKVLSFWGGVAGEYGKQINQ